MTRDRRRRSQSRPFLPLVRAGAVGLYTRFLESVGAPVERHLAAAGLSSRLADHPEGLVPLRQSLAFLDRAANAEGIECLGLLAGARAEIEQLGALGRMLRGTGTLLDAVNSVAVHIRHFNSAQRVWLLPEDGRVLLCHALNVPDADGRRHGDLLAIMLLIKTIRQAAGATWWPREIRLPVSEAKWLKWYGLCLPVDLVLHARPFYAIVLDRPLLAHGIAACGGQGETRMDEAAFLRSSAPARDLAGSVRQAISGLLTSGYPDVRLVAECTGLSVRTFKRRLAESGSSYESLVKRVRLEAAVSMVRDHHLKLIDIAYELGYADPGNFTRAFRRWTGMPPAEYRRLNDMGAMDLPAVPPPETPPLHVRSVGNS